MNDREHEGTTVTTAGCNGLACWCRGGSVQTIATFTSTPESVGTEIRRLLFTLRAPEHSQEDESAGRCNYATDELRSRALDLANICWNGSGKMHSETHRCAGRPPKLNDFSWQPPERPL